MESCSALLHLFYLFQRSQDLSFFSVLPSEFTLVLKATFFAPSCFNWMHDCAVPVCGTEEIPPCEELHASYACRCMYFGCKAPYTTLRLT